MTSAIASSHTLNDAKFFRTLVTVMAGILVSGFVFNLAMGRSSFAAPVVVHLHAAIFMGWVVIVLTQFWLAAAGAIPLHRHLGMIAIAWSGAIMVLGPWVTITAATARPGPANTTSPGTALGSRILMVLSWSMSMTRWGG